MKCKIQNIMIYSVKVKTVEYKSHNTNIEIMPRDTS